MKSLDKKKTKELNWEKEFNDRWGGNVADYQRFFHIDDEPDNDRENIKDFIKFLLTQQRTELLEEIKKMELKHSINPNSPSRERKIIYNQAIRDVINLINKKDEQI